MKVLSHALLIILFSGLVFACGGGSGGARPLPKAAGGRLPGGDEEIFRLPGSERDGDSKAGDIVKHGDKKGSGDEPGDEPRDEPGPVPEPGTLLIVGAGLAILGSTRRKRLARRRQEQH